MRNTLEYLEYEYPPPPPGQLRVVVARHEGEYVSSPETYEYAAQRSRLAHALGDDLVTDYGDTDAPDPRETVQLLLDAGAIVIPSLAAVLSAWISGRPKTKKNMDNEEDKAAAAAADSRDTVPGFLLVRADGHRLLLSGREELTRKQRRDLMEDFLGVGS